MARGGQRADATGGVAPFRRYRSPLAVPTDMMTMAAPVKLTRLLLLVAALAAALLLAGPATAARATVPPVNCGGLSVKGKRYTVKADQISCADARAHTRRYLGERRRPAGYRCANYTSTTKLRFRCAKGVRVFFAIRR